MTEQPDLQKKKSLVEVAQIGRFGIVGVLNTIVDFVVYNTMIFTFTALPVEFSAVISGTVAMVNSFIFNKNFTFKVKKLPISHIFWFFIITAVGIYIIRPLIVVLFTKIWLWPAEFVFSVTSFLNLPFSKEFETNNLALVAAISIVLVYNYLMYRFFIFKSNEKD